MKQNTMLMIGGAIVVYLLWKKSQEETTSEFSNVSGDNPFRRGPCYCNGNSIGYYTARKCDRLCSESTIVTNRDY